MSEHETAEHEERVSPYLLRPARTYEEYLRDRETSEQLLENFEAAQTSTARVTGNPSRAAGQGNRRDTADNQA